MTMLPPAASEPKQENAEEKKDNLSESSSESELVAPRRYFISLPCSKVFLGMTAIFVLVMILVPVMAVMLTSKMKDIKTETDGRAFYLCNQSACHMEAHYYDEKLDISVDPCEDYYSYVCSRNWYRLGLDLRTRPYLYQSPGYLYLGLEDFSRAYMKEEMEHIQQNRHHFGHQIIIFINSCSNENGRSSKEMESLLNVLKYFDLENWPFESNPGRKNIAQIAGKIAGHLAIFPFVETTLKRDKHYRQMHNVVALGQARFPLAKHQLADEGSGLDWYRETVHKAVRLIYSGKDVDKIAQNIVGFERQLSRSLQVVPRISFPYFKLTVADLPASQKWDWPTYLNALLKGITAVTNTQEVLVNSVQYLESLVNLIEDTPTVTVLNYLGYRIMVSLSPLLPSAANFLVPLAAERKLILVSERLQACVDMMEKVFGLGLTMVMKHATSILKQPEIGQKLTDLIGIVDTVLKKFVHRAHWMTEEERQMAAQRITNMSFSLCIPDEKITETDLGQYFIDVPQVNEKNLVESYFHMQTASRRKYWNGILNQTIDLRYDSISTLETGYEYDFNENSLFIPFGVLGFLLRSKEILPMHIPRFATYFLRGMFSVLGQRLSTYANQDATQHIWSKETHIQFSHMSWCFARQYSDTMSNEAETPIHMGDYIEEIVEDNAVLPPLYEVYRNSFPVRKGKTAIFRLPTMMSVTTDELFFMNYAVGQCEDIKNETMVKEIMYKERIPPKFKVNIPLSNFRKFAHVYKCKPGSKMRPHKTCSIWKV